jgi:hypothetical protein
MKGGASSAKRRYRERAYESTRTIPPTITAAPTNAHSGATE